MNVTEVCGQSEQLSKKSRIHCCGNGCCHRDSAEHEGYDRAFTDRRITENNITDADREKNTE